MKTKKKEKYDPFSHPRWKEVPAVEVVGESEVNAEEEQQAERYLKRIKENKALD